MREAMEHSLTTGEGSTVSSANSSEKSDAPRQKSPEKVDREKSAKKSEKKVVKEDEEKKVRLELVIIVG